MGDNDRMKEMLELVVGALESPPEDQVKAAALVTSTALTPFADNGSIDTGMGFGEACLDFWMDGKAVRVVVSRVPALDDV